MTATITRIQDSKVWCKSVNPLGERRPTFIQGNKPESWKEVDWWQQAESERVELPIIENDYGFINNKLVLYSHGELIPADISDEIQVTREGDYFKII